MPRQTPRTCIDPAALEEELARIREQGWSLDDEEEAEGVPDSALALGGFRVTRAPVVLIFSPRDADNREIRHHIRRRFPQLDPLIASEEEAAAEVLPRAEVLVAWGLPAPLLARARMLKWIQVMGTGVESLISSSHLPPGVRVTNLKGIFSTAMAEYALAYMLAQAQDIPGILGRQSRRDWAPFTPRTLAGSTVGIAGLGSIGREVARRCSALGMRVIGIKHSPGDVAYVEQVYVTAQLDQFLPRCDYLVLVLPHTPETAGLLTRERLRLLKPTCFLVNMGRGTIAREHDLAEALRSGWLAGAALDVFSTEPLPPDSPLWGLDNVYITPHVAGINRAPELVPGVLENLGRYLEGEPLLNQVDRQRGY